MEHESKILEASDFTFEELLKKAEKPVVVIVGTEWCQDTERMLKGSVPIFMEKFGKNRHFISVMLERAEARQKINPHLAQLLKVTRYPTIICFENGLEVGRKVSEGEVDEQIMDLIQVCRQK